jgi:NADPH-dependent curcumin reductase CurA
MKKNQQWLIAARPRGEVKESDFRWNEAAIADPADGQVLVRTVYISLDPANRVWMNEADSYLPSLPLGNVMRGGGLGIVEESRNPDFAKGDIVQGLLGWQQYSLSDGKDLGKLPKGLPVPLTAFFGLLGHIGLTAYFGLLHVTDPKPGETLVISTAAGAVGSLVGQIGKIKGCHVVGLTGSDEKCRWIKDELGFDAAINYKTEDVAASLRSLCPEGIDLYYDNVGGDILDICLAQLAMRGRIVLCGAISIYNEKNRPPGPRHIFNLIIKRGRMEGFLVLDYLDRFLEAQIDMVGWLAEGKVKHAEHLVEGLEYAPDALNLLFTGGNTGKVIVKL